MAGCAIQREEDESRDDAGVTVDAAAALAEAPVLSAAHGALQLPDHSFVEPTSELGQAAYSFYLARLLAEADGDVQREYVKTKRGLERVLPAGPERELRRDSALLDWLNHRVAPNDAERIAQINAAVRNALDVQQVTGMVGGTTQELVANAGGQSYITQCAAAGVPTPPAWGSASWKRASGNPLTTTFIFTNKVAEVYTYESTSPRGLCIALPRGLSGDTFYTTFGIICQGDDTGKACFWDNAANVPKTGTQPIIGTFNGGADLLGKGGGICTDCHAGENAFIVHPTTPLDRGALLKAKGWVQPIVAASWPQNPGPGRDLERVAVPSGQSSCLTCHNKQSHNRFPPLAYLNEFCSTIAAMAVNRTMPPPMAAGSAAYAAHKAAITSGCNKTPAPRARFGTTANWGVLGGAGVTYTMGDYNNDGLSDVAITFIGQPAAPGVYVSLSTGASFTFPQPWLPSFNGLDTSGGIYRADVDGDGRDDLVIMNTTGAYVLISSGVGFAAPVNIGPGTLAGQRTGIGDVNHDSFDDLVQFRQNTSEVWVSLSDGTRFGAPVNFLLGFSNPNEDVAVADFDADGFADIATVRHGPPRDLIMVALASNTGQFFKSATAWRDIHTTVATSEIPFFGDVNFDGRSDMVLFDLGSAADVSVGLSSGSSFASKALWQHAFVTSGIVPRVADVNGDLFADVISFSTIDTFVRVATSSP